MNEDPSDVSKLRSVSFSSSCGSPVNPNHQNSYEASYAISDRNIGMFILCYMYSLILILPYYNSITHKNLIICQYFLIIFLVISEGGDDDDGFTFYETITQLYSIFKIPLMHVLIFVLLTCKIPFAPADSVSMFKFQVQ